MTDYRLLRLSSMLLFVGLVLTDILHFLHPGGGPTYETTFAIYAASTNWAAIHLGQFLAEAVLLAGVISLFFALDFKSGAGYWLSLFGAVCAGIALALSGVLMAVDGVALKQAVDAWASAPASEQAARLASAEAIRWLEWGANCYWNTMQGAAAILYAAAILVTARIPRPAGALLALAGLGFLVSGWLVGTGGFTASETFPNYAAYTLLGAAAVWMLVLAWRGHAPASETPAVYAQEI